MSTKIRAIVLMAVVAVFASIMVAPASADTTGVGQFSGVANVGKYFTTPCDKNGLAGVGGLGLYAPGVNPGRAEDGVWQFATTGTAVGNTQGGPAAGTFTLAACGHLGPVVDLTADRSTVAGIGGAGCGNSKGHHGQGNAVFANGHRIKLFNLGWKSSAGGVLPVNGNYQEYANDIGDPNGAAKKLKYGVVVALVNARGGIACSGLNDPIANNGQGAQTFQVDGVTELINTGVLEAPDPKSGIPQTKYCKDGSSDASKSRHVCTPQDGGDK